VHGARARTRGPDRHAHTIASSATVISRPSCALTHTHVAYRDTVRDTLPVRRGHVRMCTHVHTRTYTYTYTRAFARRITQLRTCNCERAMHARAENATVPTTRRSRLPQPLDRLSPRSFINDGGRERDRGRTAGYE